MRGKEFRIKKSKLLDVIITNRNKHYMEYKEALCGYQNAVIVAMRAHADKVAAINLTPDPDTFIDPRGTQNLWARVELRAPQSHMDDYD